MKKFIISIATAALMLPALTFGAPLNLPKVEILGTEYYCYEVKKGDSLYGIAKQLGWDLNELVRLNPKTVSNLAKGAKLYYPTSTRNSESSQNVEKNLSDFPIEPITHVVKKGETVYSISRLYKVSVDAIYKSNPSSKFGIKADEVLNIPQSHKTVDKGDYVYYKIKRGDTLYGVSKTYQTTVADILAANPGIDESHFRAGDNIRIPVLSNTDNTKTEIVERERLGSMKNYKVEKNDSWESISKKTGVSEEQLKMANENTVSLKKNEVIAVPMIEKVEEVKEVIVEDPRELTKEGREQLYDSIHNISPQEQHLSQVNVALLMDNPNSKLDTEFARGLLIAIDEMKHENFKISLKVIDGRKSSEDVTALLDEFEPHIIMSTADKAFPSFLADYGDTNHVEVVNVFDVRNELYQDNPCMIQLLPPSNYFNDEIVDFAKEQFDGRILIIAGDQEDSDQTVGMLSSAWTGPIVEFTLEELEVFDFTDSDDYLIYACSTKKDEIITIVNAVAKAKDVVPLADISVLGRPSWITQTSTLGSKFYVADVYIPTRFYFDQEKPASKAFLEKFEEVYGHAPVKSFPMYAVCGYDVARYFIPSTSFNRGDINKGMLDANLLQTDYTLQRVSNWGGLINPTCFMLRFSPLETVERINLKYSK